MSLELASLNPQTLIKCPRRRQQGLPLPLRHTAKTKAQAGVKIFLCLRRSLGQAIHTDDGSVLVPCHSDLRSGGAHQFQ